MVRSAHWKLGYRLEGNVYRHDSNALLLEISPTDSCRDRLAAYFFWRDWSGLEQALAVARARRTNIDFERIRSWSRAEGHSAQCDEFLLRLGT